MIVASGRFVFTARRRIGRALAFSSGVCAGCSALWLWLSVVKVRYLAPNISDTTKVCKGKSSQLPYDYPTIFYEDKCSICVHMFYIVCFFLCYNASMSVNQPIQINEVTRDERGRWIKAPVSPAPITAENTHEYARRRRELKQATIQAAANEAVERGDWRAVHGDMAFVAAIAQTAYIKATTADDPKAIDAARFLLQETGLSDKQAEQVQTVTNNVMVLDDATRGMIAQLLGDGLTHGIDDVIEGGVVPPIDNYIDSSDALTPPLPHCDACLSCADSDTAQHAHDTAHSTHESRQAGTGRSEKKKRKVVGV